ncbi:hypothetical protein CEXT_729621 [Caerostris extrusa]|uniref:Uncharacterized protein n=1 Tax=Caerostris extrusa TaxID=172846 RepID=A0AAV4R047_CAEEX|nr:hypothetical protein CEXT_729621 [Caerostris extrusa]
MKTEFPQTNPQESARRGVTRKTITKTTEFTETGGRESGYGFLPIDLSCPIVLTQNLKCLEKTITLQCVPVHCGVPGNYLAKKGVFIIQNNSRPLPFCAIKHLVKNL